MYTLRAVVIESTFILPMVGVKAPRGINKT